MTGSGFLGWAAYGDSVVDVEVSGRVVTLGREGVVLGDPSALPSLLYIVTAYNPGRERPLPENEDSQQQLHDTLEARGLTTFDAVGRSRDGSWQEPSVAVTGLSESDAVDIALTFAQDAIFGWDGQRLRVIPCK